MGCWVTPTVAAELWGIPLDAVLARVHAGVLAFKIENDQLLVDLLARVGDHSDLPSAGPVPSAAEPVADVPVVPAPSYEPAAPAPLPANAAPPRRRRTRSPRLGARPVTPAMNRIATIDSQPSVSDAELSALSSSPTRSDEEEMGPAGDPDPDLDGMYPEEGPPLHWQEVRTRVSRSRRPPGSF